MSLLPVFVPQYNSTQKLASSDSWKALVRWSSLVPSILPCLTILSCRCWHADAIWRGQRKEYAYFANLNQKALCLFVCSYWDVVPLSKEGKLKYIEKEKSCSVRSPLEHPCNSCRTHNDAMEIILNSYTLWLLPKCRFYKIDRDAVVRQQGSEEGQWGIWACLRLLLPSPGLGLTSISPKK